ncbi:Terminase-like family protein [anaerobic digester metagenome]|uniref:PBSX family phage terminase large subunit n=1 Tax=Oscillibacter ruminantium TaxID=1263547 RepID=UPI000306B51C|nr:PBSX family phage terminase large subunit [Oscillibacter ruminantium]
MEAVRFSDKQRRALRWWQTDGRRYDAVICDGAVRSGKTFSMGLSFFLWAMSSFDGQQFGVCGKTILSLRRNVLQEIVPVLRKLGMTCTEKRSENLVVVCSGKRRNRFCLFGGKDESSAALIQGSTFAGVLLDEAALMPQSFVEQACARCSVAGSKLWLDCNPEGPNHWFYREWICKAREKRALYLHFTMADNPVLTEEIRARYETCYSGIFYRRFVLGEWVAAQGLIYDFFERETFCAAAPKGEMERWRVSVDYGTANPASFGLWGLRGGVWYRVEEYYYNSRMEGRQKTDEEYVEDMRKLIGERKVETVVADPSAASFITALRQAGFSVEKADNNVLDGIRTTADALKSGKIVICEGCEDCLREMEGYCWESGNRDAPKKENDHAMDDLRYFAMSIAKPQGAGFAATWVEREM